jgi:hypothetical protein
LPIDPGNPTLTPDLGGIFVGEMYFGGIDAANPSYNDISGAFSSEVEGTNTVGSPHQTSIAIPPGIAITITEFHAQWIQTIQGERFPERMTLRLVRSDEVLTETELSFVNPGPAERGTIEQSLAGKFPAGLGAIASWRGALDFPSGSTLCVEETHLDSSDGVIAPFPHPYPSEMFYRFWIRWEPA